MPRQTNCKTRELTSYSRPIVGFAVPCRRVDTGFRALIKRLENEFRCIVMITTVGGIQMRDPVAIDSKTSRMTRDYFENLAKMLPVGGALAGR